MKNHLKKSIGYGLVVFLLAFIQLRALTSPDWHEVNYGKGIIILHLIPVFKAFLAGIFAGVIVTILSKKAPTVMKRIHLGFMFLTRGVIAGIIAFSGWVGIGGMQLMIASEEMITLLYRSGFLFGSSIAILSLPFNYCFWRRHKRLIAIDDFSEF